MKKSEFILKSFLHSAGVAVYVTGLSLFVNNAQKLFGPKDNKFFIPIFMLLLFIISASITALLVLGKPISLYLQGLRKEAWQFLFYTLGWLAVFLVIVGIILASVR